MDGRMEERTHARMDNPNSLCPWRAKATGEYKKNLSIYVLITFSMITIWFAKMK